MINGLPQRLSDVRNKFGYTQKSVATRIGVSASVVSGYETGERTPSLENLLALSYLYKCSTDYLLGRTREKPGTFIDISGLNEDQIRAVNQLVDTMRR